ncbi:MAG: fatty acid desaturase [Alphaproteobacteria bacterium]|nr:fatty acid desaturase [Alphaproteobacteria bacterium]
MSRRITSAADTRRFLAARSDAKGAERLAAHLALLVAAGFVLTVSLESWLALPAMTAYGVILIALFAPLHETLHRTAFRTRRLNDAVAATIGFVHFLPAGHFRRFHAAHHRHVQDPARDPELAAPKPATRAAYLWTISTIPYWGSRLRELARHAAGRVDAPFIPPAARPMVVREARWHIAGWAAVVALSIAFGWSWPLIYWLLPTLLGQPFLRLYLMAEHGGCETGPDLRRNTRTVHSNPLVRFLMWNMPYHIEHHAAPAVPFHVLPAMHETFDGAPIIHAPGYVTFHRATWRELTFR